MRICIHKYIDNWNGYGGGTRELHLRPGKELYIHNIYTRFSQYARLDARLLPLVQKHSSTNCLVHLRASALFGDFYSCAFRQSTTLYSTHRRTKIDSSSIRAQSSLHTPPHLQARQSHTRAPLMSSRRAHFSIIYALGVSNSAVTGELYGGGINRYIAHTRTLPPRNAQRACCAMIMRNIRSIATCAGDCFLARETVQRG